MVFSLPLLLLVFGGLFGKGFDWGRLEQLFLS